MKKTLLALLAFTILWSCENSVSSDGDYGTPITVSLGIGGDVSVSTAPVTKGGADTGIYGINVYFDKEKDGNTNDIYAFGLFDNVADMTITLLSGYKYTFKCTLVKNGIDKLYYGQYGGNSYSGYAKPFQTNKKSSSQVTNSFNYTNNSGGEYLSGIDSGIAIVDEKGAASDDSPHPKLNRYYGEAANYSPVVGGVVTIPLKKTCFGLKLIIRGVPEGTLSANVKIKETGVNLASLSKSTKKEDYIGEAITYSFKSVYEYAMTSINTGIAVVSWAFTSSKFDQWNLSGSSEITIKRNILTTITVSVTPDSASGSVSLTEEEWDDDNIINMGINSDGLIDIVVNPEPED